MGVGAGYIHEAFSDSASTTNSAEMGKIKIGYGNREAYAIEFSFDYFKNDENVFSSTGKDSDKFGMNVELVKALDIDTFFNPYFKAGFGAGFVDVNHDDQSSLNYSTFNLGFGFYIPINEHLDIDLGYDYKYISYEELTSTSSKVTSNLNGAYLGINVRF
ncbi:MAG: opacity protein-like surface antigen [Sulfurimonas sp.]|jgi:opacity protein-like surface antigen